ncbi:uncharacterized protein LOC134132707 [Pungitius pungitius]|uniref:uncharacterized protein LOC134132707 n=1 Tax=Pungitius pungitius TaxID=134920 RepID=UPI002E0D98AF
MLFNHLPGSVVVDSELIFANASLVPAAIEAQITLVEAASNNSNFSLPVNVSTIVAMAPTAAPTTTEAPASTDPPTSSEGTLRLLFSLIRAFTSDLSNASSAEFKKLVAEVIKEVNRVAKNLYGPSFRRTIINSFSNGSVKVDSTLVFKDKNSVPEASNATSQFISALTNSSLGIVNGSISAQSLPGPNATFAPSAAANATVATTAAPIATVAPTAAPAQSTSTSSSPPVPTMGSMAVFLLTLLAVAQMLVDL